MSTQWEGEFHSTSRMSAGLVGGALDTLQIQEKSLNLLADGSASGLEAVLLAVWALYLSAGASGSKTIRGVYTLF